MEESIIWFIVAIVTVLIAGFVVLYFQDKRKKAVPPPSGDARKEAVALQLQAYERLVLLSERLSLPNLVTRVYQPEWNARDMQLALSQTIRQEFDYNLTQQIYVSPQAWEAVKNLKEQNLLVINQLAGILPAGASAMDLNKRILDFVMHHPKGTLHSLVLEALNFEAKKVISV